MLQPRWNPNLYQFPLFSWSNIWVPTFCMWRMRSGSLIQRALGVCQMGQTSTCSAKDALLMSWKANTLSSLQRRGYFCFSQMLQKMHAIPCIKIDIVKSQQPCIIIQKQQIINSSIQWIRTIRTYNSQATDNTQQITNRMESQKEKKQEFLREQILQAGYDPEEFITYLTEEKLASDIDSISFKQLEVIVDRFKKFKETGSPEKRPSQVHLEFDEGCEIIGEEGGSASNKPKDIYYEKYGVSEPEFTKTFKCLKLKEDKNYESSPKIEVSDPIRKTTGGFFGIGATSFLLFKVDTSERGWSVRRRYSDFQWLRAIVLKFFPTHIIPPLPKKDASKRTTRDLVKRMNILMFFLNDLASYSEIFSSKYVEGFMAIVDDSKFQKLKKQGNDAQAFETINSLETPTGEVVVNMSAEQNKFGEELHNFFESAQHLYRSVNDKTKRLQNSFVDETNILYEMGNHFADLHGHLKVFNNNSPSFAQSDFGTVFVTLNNMVIEWGNIVKNQYQFLQKSFRPFFRYIRNEIYSYREQYAKIKEIQEDYFKAKVSLEKKKEKIFALNDVRKWEIPENKLSMVPPGAIKKKEEAMQYMLPKESQQLDKNLMNYAFYMSQYKDNAVRLLQHGTERFNENFKQFAINIKVNAQQLAGLWTEVATNFANPPQQQKLLNKQSEVEKSEFIGDD